MSVPKRNELADWRPNRASQSLRRNFDGCADSSVTRRVLKPSKTQRDILHPSVAHEQLSP
ncbi:MAG: hypothetical protein OXC95_03285 [Dehalococcoidia bacterium]|nr:hypothetical protein [Dehalococcoidia bacterium]